MSDEKYVTLTEALEWEKRVRAELSEDALVEALLWARGEAESKFLPAEWRNNRRDQASRALLEAARWFREHQNVAAGMLWCIKCNPKRRGIDHDPECTVGRWVRAAERAGL